MSDHMEDLLQKVVLKLQELDGILFEASGEQGIFQIAVNAKVMQLLETRCAMDKRYNAGTLNGCFPQKLSLYLYSGAVDFVLDDNNSSKIPCPYCKSLQNPSENKPCTSCGAILY